MTIDEGYTLDYLIPGFFVGAAGLGLIYASVISDGAMGFIFEQDQLQFTYPLGALLVLIAAQLIALKSGIEITENPSRIRVYKSVFGKRLGSWKSLENIESAKLALTYESMDIMSRGGERTYTTKTFDLFLMDKNGHENEFHHFTKRNLGIKTLKELKRQGNISVRDETRRSRLA